MWCRIEGGSPLRVPIGGPEDAEPVRRVFLCTAREVLLIEMEIFSGWGSEAPLMLDAYVRACEIKLNLSE
jgi:hypothetical protein